MPGGQGQNLTHWNNLSWVVIWVFDCPLQIFLGPEKEKITGIVASASPVSSTGNKNQHLWCQHAAYSFIGAPLSQHMDSTYPLRNIPGFCAQQKIHHLSKIFLTRENVKYIDK